MLPSRYQLISPATHPDYYDMVGSLGQACWPEFMLHDPVADEYWDKLFEHFSEYQFGLLDTESGSYIVPGALHPVEFNLESDEGLYIESNVWTVHINTGT